MFAFYDYCSRRWIYNLVTKPNYFQKPFCEALKNSFILMRNPAVSHGVRNIRLPEIGCSLDKLQPSRVHEIRQAVFQQANVFITVCVQNDNLAKRNG